MAYKQFVAESNNAAVSADYEPRVRKHFNYGALYNRHVIELSCSLMVKLAGSLKEKPRQYI